jgi:hypothetical protein|tara:strand:- start:688 stop:1626 length:939 start_codon:yes stop_codon:yes gene_type:complete
MARLHFISHCLPREIDDFDRILDHFHRASYFLQEGDEIALDCTLNLSDDLTNWDESSIPKKYFEDKWNMMEEKADWTFKNHFDIVYDGSVMGCGDKRRNSIRKYANETTHFTYFDCDIFFSQYTLSYIFRTLEQVNNEFHIVTPQILRLWDAGWDVISNDRFIPYGDKSFIWKTYDHYKLDKECFDYLDEVGVKPIPTFKFGGGLLTTFSANLLTLTDLPDSLGPYGLDDTFVMQCCGMAKQHGIDIQQYVIENIIVMENKRYRNKNPYINLLKDYTIIDGGQYIKKKFRKVAEDGWDNAISEFTVRMLDVK